MIDKFDGTFAFLSNFYLVNIEVEGVIYPSTEHAYQAMKTLDADTRQFIAELETPGEAKKWGRTIDIRKDWEDVKVDIMYSLVKQKFTKYKTLRLALHYTAYEELVEGNWWGDKFWGMCKGEGENHLGKILMRIREENRHG